MKKKLILTAFILIVAVASLRVTIVNTMAKQVDVNPKDILYQDVIITALTPTINKAVADYYKNIFSETPFYDISSIKIINIERPNGDRTSKFIIKFEVTPFFGPHITVGRDKISIELSYPGIQELKSFEHVEDHPLPDRYKDLYLQ